MIRNYSKLTIKQYLALKRISETETDPLMRSVRMLSEITGQTVEEIEDMPLDDVKKQLKKLHDIETLTPESRVRMNIKVKGERFVVIWELNKLTASQYIEVSQWTKDSSQIIYNIHKILASLVVRKTWYGKQLKRDASEHKYISDLFYNHLTIEQAYPIMLFFCRFSEALHASTQTYLVQEAEKLNKELNQIIIKNGDG